MTIALLLLAPLFHQENGEVTNRDRQATSGSKPVLIEVTRGTEHGCGLDAAGRAYCWGSNRLGQLGDDHSADRTRDRSVLVATAERFVSISAGANHTCALTAEGVAYCWGLDFTGELGRSIVANTCGIYPCSRRPVRVETSLTFDTLSAGFGHTCAVRAGRAYCWGRNDRGQTGVAVSSDDCLGVACNVFPRLVTGLAEVTSISAGGDHTCAMAGSRPYCWGSNQYGQLGRETQGESDWRPAVVERVEHLSTIRAMGIRTCGTSSDGREHCWGGSPRGTL